MKVFSVVRKSAKEQVRHFWILVLTVSMAPFFILVYYLINEASKPHYDLLILNRDQGIESLSGGSNYGALLLDGIRLAEGNSLGIPLTVREIANRSDAIEQLNSKKVDMLVVIPEEFSQRIVDLGTSQNTGRIRLEFVGDLTNIKYMVTAVWANEIVNELLYQATSTPRPVEIVETSLGVSGEIDDFDMYVPGIVILAVIMLMFSAAIAIVTEVENKTILRLKLSKLSALEFLSGVSVVQILVGIASALLTLVTAVVLGFDHAGSLLVLLFIVALTAVSIIAFSLIVAAFTNTVNEVLVVANFPLFLFMFFSGAAFPIKGVGLFTVAGYPVTVQGLMSPTHAISAVNKVLILNTGVKAIVPEIIALLIITLLYFAIGLWAFRRRHMQVS